MKRERKKIVTKVVSNGCSNITTRKRIRRNSQQMGVFDLFIFLARNKNIINKNKEIQRLGGI